MTSKITTTTTTQRPDIPLPTTETSEGVQLVPVSKQELADHKKEIKSDLSTIQNVLIGITIAFLLGFITFILDAYHLHIETTRQFEQTIQELHNQNIDLKIQSAINKVDNLEKKIDASASKK